MSRNIEKFVVFNLRQTYHELGEYEFKVVLSPKFFKNSHSSEFSLVDSDGRKVPHIIKKWGRKVNCSFVIDEGVADGVAVVRLVCKDEKDQVDLCTFSFWIVKP